MLSSTLPYLCSSVLLAWFVLTDIISHPTSLVWKAYRLDHSWDPSGATVDPLTFCKRLHLYLGDVCNYVSHMTVYTLPMQVWQ